MEKFKLGLAGLGDFGSRFFGWQQSTKAMENAEFIFCVEPNTELWSIAENANIPCYKNIESVPQNLLKSTSVIVDCATKGQGPNNIVQYQKLNLPAVFQNGEQAVQCPLFYEPLAKKIPPNTRYLRIVKCSAMIINNIALALGDRVVIKKIQGSFFKVNSRSTMLALNYPSGKEVEQLIGISTRVNRVYLRGTAFNQQAVYHGDLRLFCDNAPCLDDIIKILAASMYIKIVHDDIDTNLYHRDMHTLVVQESIAIVDNWLEMKVVAHTPECNFPHLASAIQLLTR